MSPPLAFCFDRSTATGSFFPVLAELPFRPLLAFAPELPPLLASPVSPPPPLAFALASPVSPPFALDDPPLTVLPPLLEVEPPPFAFDEQRATLQVSALPPLAFDELSTFALASPPLPPLPAIATPPVELASPLAAMPLWLTCAFCEATCACTDSTTSLTLSDLLLLFCAPELPTFVLEVSLQLPAMHLSPPGLKSLAIAAGATIAKTTTVATRPPSHPSLTFKVAPFERCSYLGAARRAPKRTRRR